MLRIDVHMRRCFLDSPIGIRRAVQDKLSLMIPGPTPVDDTCRGTDELERNDNVMKLRRPTIDAGRRQDRLVPTRGVRERLGCSSRRLKLVWLCFVFWLFQS